MSPNNTALNILIYLFSFSVVFENYDGLSIAGNSIPKLLGILIALLIILINGIKIYNNYTNIIVLPLLLFLIAVTLSCFLNYTNSLDWLWRYNSIVTSVFIFILLLSYTFDKKYVLDRVVAALNIGILLTTILYIFNIGVEFEAKRLEIFGENANTIGLLSVITLIYIISLITEKKHLSNFKYLLLFAFIPLINMIASSGSRTTFLSLILSLFVFFMLKRSTHIGLKIFTILPLFLLVQYLLSFKVLRDRVYNSVETGDLSGREAIWENVLPYLIEKPIFGVGVNGYFDVSFLYYSKFFSPHNVFVEIFAYSGLVGLVFFLIFYYRLFKMTLIIKRRDNIMLPLVLIVIMFTVFFTGQGLTTKPFWLIYLYVIGTFLNYNGHYFQYFKTNKD